VIERVNNSWRLFASSRPGRRFQERCRRNQSNRRGHFHPVRLLYVVGGVMLVIVSALFGWLPVLGWSTAFLGLGMIAGEFYPTARFADWLEVRARKRFEPLGKTFMRLPTWVKLSIYLMIAVSTFALVYGFYSLTFSS
jgi:hypothetical protein